MKNIFHKALSFTALNKSMGTILLAVILLEMGERMAERFLPIYIMALGGGALAISGLNALDNLLGAIYAFPGGYLSDKIGHKKALLLFDLVAMLGYLIIIIIPTWQAAIIGAILFISWSSISLPAIMSAISKILPLHKRTMGVSLHSLVRRIPMALGPIIGGALISSYGETTGVRLAFIVSFLLALFAIFFQQKFIKADQPISAKISLNPFTVWKLMKADLKHLLISDILIRFCEQIPYAFVVIWCMKNLKISAIDFGLLTTAEMTTAMLIYIPVALMVEKNKTKKPFVAITFAFFAAFPMLLYYSRSLPLLFLAFIVRGLKEFGEPTRKALILDLANEGSAGTIYGAYYLIRDIVVSIAAFGAGILWNISPFTNFMVATVFGLIGLLHFIFFCQETKTE